MAPYPQLFLRFFSSCFFVDLFGLCKLDLPRNFLIKKREPTSTIYRTRCLNFLLSHSQKPLLHSHLHLIFLLVPSVAVILRDQIMCPSGTAQRAVVEASLSTDLRPAFDVLDADRDGKISRDDLRTFYAGFSSGDADEEAIKSMISVADSNRDGFVEYDEFERVLGDRRGSSTAGRRGGGVMEDVFRMMDKDGDGKLSHEDLKSYMQWAGFSASDADIRAMIALGGGSNEKDGVSYDGLLKILAIDFVG